MKLIKINGKYVLDCTYAERHAAKDAGMRWNAATKEWYTTDIVVARKLKEYAIDSDVQNSLASEEKKTIDAVAASKAVDVDVDLICKQGLEYMPFQRAGIAFARERENVLIADEMGLGKTIQALGICNNTQAQKILIICPASLKLNWQRESEKWLKEKKEIEILNGKESARQAQVYIINYDILSKHKWIAEENWDIVICDESHYLKNPKAIRTKSALEILKKAKKKIMLTGTPILNRPIELQTVLAALGCDFAKNWFGYAKRYCGAYKSRFGWDVSGASNLEELQEKLRSSVMIRRLKKDVLLDLPAKTRQIIEIPQGGFSSVLKNEAKIMKSYDEKKKVLAELKKQAEEQKDNADFKNKIESLRNAISLDFAEISRVRHETALAKTEFTIEYINDMLESRDKVILFAHHIDVIDKLSSAFPDISVKFTGEMTAEDKQKSVDKFQNDANCKIFIGSIMAAGVGITLTAANTVVFHELEWTPSAISQAEDRAHRIGQKENVLVQHLVIDGSIDSMLAKKIKSKQEIIEKALDRSGLTEEIEL
ncbi:MAG: DEAD/DEAH box helicase [Bacteroidia bacterium]|nr:DEAD/DEAH box helicase [Bacteroidia bacterium]